MLACVVYKKRNIAGALSVLNIQGSTKTWNSTSLCGEKKVSNFFLSVFFIEIKCVLNVS